MTSKPTSPFPESKIIRRLTMWAPDPSSPNKERAQMTFGLKGNNLEILVWTKGPQDGSRGPIRGNLGLIQVEMLCELIKQVTSTEGKNFADVSLNHSRSTNPEDPKAPKEIYEQAVIRVAKNSEGLMSIGVFDHDETRSRIFFPFLLDRWTGGLKKNGEPMDLAQVSCMVADSYARILRSVMTNNAEITSNEENRVRYPSKGEQRTQKPRQQEKSTAPSSDFDVDDIPY